MNMRFVNGNFLKLSLVSILSFTLIGCAVNFKKTPPEEVKKAKQWKRQATSLDYELKRLKEEKQREIKKLKDAKESLEYQLRKEMKDKDVSLKYNKRGLVITLLDRILFDSGKAKLKEGAYEVLDKVSRILKTTLRNKEIGIEGHTDNQPIKFSNWESNWELSTARALSVLHYFEKERGVDPGRLSAIGYGSHRPSVSNDTPELRQKNRRVEIVILPDFKKAEREYYRKKSSYEDIK